MEESEFEALLSAMDNLPVQDVTRVASQAVNAFTDTWPNTSLSHEDQTNPLLFEVEISDDGDVLVSQISEEKETNQSEDTSIGPPVIDTGDDNITKPRLYQIASDIFGEELVDVQGTNTSFHLYILFPEINITNSKGHKHLIRELFVKFSIAVSNYGYSTQMTGMRTALTPAEVARSYGHSHLPQEAAKGQFVDFCQGNSLFKAITTNLISRPTEDQWTLALLSLTKYLEWESLEGGPHKEMRNIGVDSSFRPINFAAELLRFIDYLPSRVLDITDRLELNYGSPQLYEFYNLHSPHKSLQRDETLVADEMQIDWNTHNRLDFTFKGKKQSMRIVPRKVGVTMEEVTTVEPAIVEEFNMVIVQHLTTFNKLLNYEFLKYKNRAVLGKVPTFEQADINHYQAIAREYRLRARKSRKPRVVGRVNHIRKREDNRFR